MKDETQTLIGLVLGVTLVGVAAVLAILLRLDRPQVFTLGLILFASLGLAVVLAGVASVLRARRPDPPPSVERHVIRERVLDGRQPPRTHIVTLPGQSALPMGLYPHLLRGAYQAGRNSADREEGSGWDGYEDWEGEIIDGDGRATQNP